MKMLEQIRLLPQNYYRVTIGGVNMENRYVTDTIIYTDDLYLNFKTDTFAEICKLIENASNMGEDLSQIDKDEFSYIDISEYKLIMHISIDLYKNGVWYGVDIVDDDAESPEYDVAEMSITRIINIQKVLIETIVYDSFKSGGVEIIFAHKSDSDGQSINVKKKYSPKYVKVTYDDIYTMANYDYDKYPNLDILLSGINFHIFIEYDALVKALPLLNENPDYKFGLTRYGGAEYKDVYSLSVVSKYDDGNVKEEDSDELNIHTI